MSKDVGKFLRKYLRKAHRWLALPFAILAVSVLLTRGTPAGPLVQQAQQILMLIMIPTGVYLLILPWWTRWNRDRRGVDAGHR
jgi:hypothetical protein